MSQITRVQFGAVEYDGGRGPVQLGSLRFRRAVLVARVEAEGGARGLGVIWSVLESDASYAEAASTLFAEALTGLDALAAYEIAARCQSLGAAAGMSLAACALELAIWDLAGHLWKVPTAVLLGRKRTSIPAYVVSSEEFGFEHVEQYLDLLEGHVRDGFRAFKLHLWGDARRDIDACARIRDAFGSGITFMLDPISRYRRNEALQVGRALEDLAFTRLEDPISPLDHAGYEWLASRLNVPVVVNESQGWSLSECDRATRGGVVQGLRFNPLRTGIVAWANFAAVAQANQAELDISSFAPRGGVEACLSLALAGATTRWFEHHTTCGLGEVPGLRSGVVFNAGVASGSGRPGLGFDVDWAELDRHTHWFSR
ncbi:MAG: enolase C-terminal domain-like protein [Beijerinckiaceae bacterium]|nr:enolase C-terminal domain-like protein [Beijerinckiaceae bacterium]